MPLSYLRKLLLVGNTPKVSRGLPGRFRPQVESLEDRWVLTTVHWINPAGGFWSDPAGWNTGAVPGPGDDVVLDTPGDVSVIHAAGDDAVNSITGTDTLVLSGGSLTLAAASDFDGSLDLVGGTLAAGPMLTVNGPLLWTAGTMTGAGITVANGGLDIAGPDSKLLHGTLQNTQNGTLSGSPLMLQNGGFDNLSGATLDIWGSGIQTNDSNNSSGIWNQGYMQLTDSVGLGGSFTNDGDLEVLSGGLGLGGYLDTVDNNGTIELNGGNFGANGKYFDDSGSITGAGNVYVAFDEQTNVTGPITATGDMNLTLNLVSLSGPGFSVGGTLTIDAEIIGIGNTSIQAGAISLRNGPFGSGISNSNISVDSSFEISADAVFEISNSAVSAPTFTPGGGEVKFTGSTLTADSLVNEAYLTFDSASSFTIGDITNTSQGFLGIAGSISGNLVNSGELAVGGLDGIGQLTVGGDFTQTATGRLDLSIAGRGADQYDQLHIGGTAYLDGTLTVDASSSLMEGDSFQAITFGSAVGNFARYVMPNLGPDLMLDAVLGDGGLTLVVQRQG